MRFTLTLDEHKPQEQALLRQLKLLAQEQTRRPTSPFPFSWLEQGIGATLRGLEWAVHWVVCAFIR